MRVNLVAKNYSMWLPFDPSTVMERMLGGGETALIACAKALGKEHRVRVYVPQGKGTFDGVEWRSTDERVTDCDVLICWETDRGTENVEADTRIIASQCNDPFIYNHIDYLVSPSQWLAKYINDRYQVQMSKMVIIPNGVYGELYDRDAYKVAGRMIWSSSPDRGLHHLLRMFPKIKKKCPEAHLRIFYAFWPQFEANKYGMHLTSEVYWKVRRGLAQPGVEYVGPVGKRQLAEEQLSSELLVYPEDTICPTEGFGITYAEALAARVAVVAPDVDAVGQIWGDYIALMPPPPHCDKDWIDIAVMLLKDENERKKYWERGRDKVFECYTWSRVGEHWLKFIGGLNVPSTDQALVAS